MGCPRRAWTRCDIRASAVGLGAQGKRGQGSSGHRGRLLAWRARPLALHCTEQRHARGQVRAEQGRRHSRGRAAGGVRGKEEGESYSVGPAWQRLRVDGSEGRWWCWAGLGQGAAEWNGGPSSFFHCSVQYLHRIFHIFHSFLQIYYLSRNYLCWYSQALV